MTQADTKHLEAVAEQVRAACIQAALEGYEDAAADGLCHEGAWESAIDAIRRLDLTVLLAEQPVYGVGVSGDQTSMRWPSGSKR
jgi:hypothetical protein